MNIYDFKVTDARGEEVPLTKYQGKVLLIVNTATGCGFTPQYEGLQKLYDKFKDKGLEIHRYAPVTKPEKIESDILKLL